MSLFVYFVILLSLLLLGFVLFMCFPQIRLAILMIYITFVLIYWHHLHCMFRALYYGVVAIHKRTGDNRHATEVARSVFGSGMYKLHVFGKLPKRPVIFAVNYPYEFIEYLYWIIFEKQGLPISMVVKDLNKVGAMRKYMFGAVFSDDNYIPIPTKGDAFVECMDRVDYHTSILGRSIWVYPERKGYGKPKYSVTPLRSGFFVIAEKLGLPVVPVVCSHLSSCSKELRFHFGPELMDDAENMKQYTLEFMRRQLHLNMIEGY
jgi:1-acyl-sn-glycerol-3-phosphate acyltransferase